MRKREVWVGVLAIVASGALGLACPPADKGSLSGQECLIDGPCEDDPSQVCKVNVCHGGGPGLGAPTGTGGGSATSGSGGSESVDASGSIVQLTTTAFDTTGPYTGPITVIAPGAITATVEADAVGGAFALTGAASGVQWVLAQDGDGGAGGAFSTYSLQDLDGVTPLVLPVVPVEIVGSVATQVSLGALKTGSAHLVLEVQDQNGLLLDGVELPTLAGSTVAYDVAPGQYATGVAGTGTQGLAVAMNVAVAATGELTLGLSYDGTSYPVTLAIAPNTVTYGLIAIDTSP